MFQVHKPGQAKLSRTVTFLGGLLLIAWGCRSLLYELRSFSTAGANGVAQHPMDLAWNEILGGASKGAAWRADLIVVESSFSPALTAAVVVLIAASAWWFWLLNRPRIADHLVEMEAEMHKVSWPTFSDAWQSTLVVSGFTALIVVLVFTYDIVIKGIVELMPVRRI